MNTLHAIAVLIGGGLDDGLKSIFGALGDIRLKYPDSAAQIDKLSEWLTSKTSGQFTPDAILNVAKTVVDLVSGKGWGPPNPGSITGM